MVLRGRSGCYGASLVLTWRDVFFSSVGVGEKILLTDFNPQLSQRSSLKHHVSLIASAGSSRGIRLRSFLG